ncbi:MAG: HAD-IIA family hydrolase [Acidimicrobiia bacterium]
MNRAIDGIIFDIDGTVARGRRVLPGALETLDELRRRRIRFAFFTNDNAHTIEFWVERLGAMGIDAGSGEIVTSALVAAEVMAKLHSASPILPVGDVGLLEALRAKDLDLVGFDDADRATAVVMGKDPDFDQQRLAVVCGAIWNGAEFFATNYDPKVPTANGYTPGSGAMVKAVAYATGREPVVTGKPSPWSGQMAMRILGVPPERGVVVGDQLATDIAMGHNAGIGTVLVLTGTADAHDAKSAPREQRPDVVIGSVGDLVPWLDSQLESAPGEGGTHE